MKTTVTNLLNNAKKSTDIENLRLNIKTDFINLYSMDEELVDIHKVEILSIINELSNQIGIRYIILEPLRKEEKLVKFYKEFGFDFIPKNINWMYLDIQQLN